MVSLIEGEKEVGLADLTTEEQRMLSRSRNKLGLSHHPYSKSEHCVAATVMVLLPSGRYEYHTSPNIEVRPRSGACGEDGAVLLTFGHVYKGESHAKYALAIGVVDQYGDGSATAEVPYPCANSRGYISELAGLTDFGDDFPVFVATTNFDKIVETTIGVLLPHARDYP